MPHSFVPDCDDRFPTIDFLKHNATTLAQVINVLPLLNITKILFFDRARIVGNTNRHVLRIRGHNHMGTEMRGKQRKARRIL